MRGRGASRSRADRAGGICAQVGWLHNKLQVRAAFGPGGVTTSNSITLSHSAPQSAVAGEVAHRRSRTADVNDAAVEPAATATAAVAAAEAGQQVHSAAPARAMPHPPHEACARHMRSGDCADVIATDGSAEGPPQSHPSNCSLRCKTTARITSGLLQPHEPRMETHGPESPRGLPRLQAERSMSRQWAEVWTAGPARPESAPLRVRVE